MGRFSLGPFLVGIILVGTDFWWDYLIRDHSGFGAISAGPILEDPFVLGPNGGAPKQLAASCCDRAVCLSVQNKAVQEVLLLCRTSYYCTYSIGTATISLFRTCISGGVTDTSILKL